MPLLAPGAAAANGRAEGTGRRFRSRRHVADRGNGSTEAGRDRDTGVAKIVIVCCRLTFDNVLDRGLMTTEERFNRIESILGHHGNPSGTGNRPGQSIESPD